jgi:Radial spoke protein 3
LSEVLQEDELASIRGRREEFEAIRNSELAEVQRLEAEVRRKQEERARRLAQERARLQQERDVQRKVAAAAFARSFVSVMRKNLLNNLKGRGYFYDPLHRAVETQVLPGIYEALAQRSDTREVVAATLADDLLADALTRGGARFTEWLKAEEERKKREEEEAEAERKRKEEEKARKKAEAEAAAAAAAAAEGGEGAAEE